VGARIMASGESVTYKWIVGVMTTVFVAFVMVAANAHTNDHSDIRDDIKIIQQDVKSILKELK
jgi:uncharacterized membrane protein YgaE (UPF0421/DUF939 family)